MTEPKFTPKLGQIDYTNVRYAPVINVLVTYHGKILMVQRSSELRLYPNYWHVVSGFLDDDQSVEDKTYEELHEELGLAKTDVTSLQLGHVLLQEAPEYKKTWLVVPVLARIKTEKFQLDWEAQRAQWFEVGELKKLKLLPDLDEVLKQFLKVL